MYRDGAAGSQPKRSLATDKERDLNHMSEANVASNQKLRKAGYVM
jgi:hypothetical protein